MDKLPPEIWDDLGELDEAFLDSSAKEETNIRYSSFENFVRHIPLGLRIDKYETTSLWLPYTIASMIERLKGRHSNINSKTRTLAYLIHYGTIKLLTNNNTFKKIRTYVKILDPLISAIDYVAPSLVEYFNHILSEPPNPNIIPERTIKLTYRPLRYFSPQGEPKSSAYEILMTSSEPIIHTRVAFVYAFVTAILDSEVWVPQDMKRVANKYKKIIENHIEERLQKLEDIIWDTLKILIIAYPYHKNNDMFSSYLKLVLTRIKKYYPGMFVELYKIPGFADVRKELMGDGNDDSGEV